MKRISDSLVVPLFRPSQRNAYFYIKNRLEIFLFSPSPPSVLLICLNSFFGVFLLSPDLFTFFQKLFLGRWENRQFFRLYLYKFLILQTPFLVCMPALDILAGFSHLVSIIANFPFGISRFLLSDFRFFLKKEKKVCPNSRTSIIIKEKYFLSSLLSLCVLEKSLLLKSFIFFSQEKNAGHGQTEKQ